MTSYILFFCSTEKCQRDDGCQWDKNSCGSSNTSTPSHIQGGGAASGNLPRVHYLQKKNSDNSSLRQSFSENKTTLNFEGVRYLQNGIKLSNSAEALISRCRDFRLWSTAAKSSLDTA